MIANLTAQGHSYIGIYYREPWKIAISPQVKTILYRKIRKTGRKLYVFWRLNSLIITSFVHIKCITSRKTINSVCGGVPGLRFFQYDAINLWDFACRVACAANIVMPVYRITSAFPIFLALSLTFRLCPFIYCP